MLLGPRCPRANALGKRLRCSLSPCKCKRRLIRPLAVTEQDQHKSQSPIPLQPQLQGPADDPAAGPSWALAKIALELRTGTLWSEVGCDCCAQAMQPSMLNLPSSNCLSCMCAALQCEKSMPRPPWGLPEVTKVGSAWSGWHMQHATCPRVHLTSQWLRAVMCFNVQVMKYGAPTGLMLVAAQVLSLTLSHGQGAHCSAREGITWLMTVVYGQIMLIHTHCWCGLTSDLRVGLSTGCSATAYHQPSRKGSCWLRLHKRRVRSMTVTAVNHACTLDRRAAELASGGTVACWPGGVAGWHSCRAALGFAGILPAKVNGTMCSPPMHRCISSFIARARWLCSL